MMRGKPVLAYARWQLLDYFFERSIPTLLIGAIMGLPLILSVRGMGMMDQESNPLLQNMFQSALVLLLTQLAPVFTLVTINKIVAEDRAEGYYRFLFAKPISVAHYYAQLFVVKGIGMAVVTLILALIANAVNVPVPVGPVLLYFLMTYVAVGGLGFLLSVLVRFDWQAMIAMIFAAYYLYSKYEKSGGIAEALVHLLPPIHLSSGLASSLLSGQPVDMGHLVWSLGYGAACFVIGIIALRYRPLAS